MIVEKHAIEILDRYSDVAPFVDSVNEAADSDKNALGFFPSRVFEDFARKNIQKRSLRSVDILGTIKVKTTTHLT